MDAGSPTRAEVLEAPPRDPSRFRAIDVRRHAEQARDARDFDLADMLEELARRLAADEQSLRGLPYLRWAQRCRCPGQPKLLSLPAEQPTPICPSCRRTYGVIR